MPRREYFVIDGNGYVSFNEEPEAFGTLSKAMARGEEMARSEPGHTVVVAATVCWIKCPVVVKKPKLQVRKLKRGKHHAGKRAATARGAAKTDQHAQ